MTDFASLLKAQATEAARRMGAHVPDRVIDQTAMRALHQDEHGAYAELVDSKLIAAELEAEARR